MKAKLNDNDCTYGVYYEHKNPLNSNYKVYGKNSLQNATLQGVEMILKTVPEDININIYIDCESVLKVLWRLPLTPREEHHTVKLNMIKRIYSLITKRTGNTTFKQVFLHLTDTNSSKSPETIEKHLKAMQDMYGEVRAARLMKGNQGADTEASSGLFRLVPKAPTINKWHNEYVLKSKRVKQSAKNNTKGFITKRFRDHIKGQLRKNLKYECAKSGKHSDWLDNTNTSVHSWGLMKSLNHKHEKYKNHMVKIVHNTLPTKEKIMKRINKEIENNRAKNTENTFGKIDTNI